ncbi:hypothetical protein QJQ45_022884 [Haematococcus lacustris]|nr:hypothetical protein QJQ45_022884 [Haematococcus lacustris]
MQRIGENRWRPLELCYWPDQAALPAKGKEYPELCYKRLRDKPSRPISSSSSSSSSSTSSSSLLGHRTRLLLINLPAVHRTMRGRLMTVVLLSLLAAGFQIAHGLEPQRSLGETSASITSSLGQPDRCQLYAALGTTVPDAQALAPTPTISASHTSSSPVWDKVLRPMAACLQCGVPAINVTSTVVQDPSNIIPIGSCINPHNISVDLGSSSWVPTTSTCNTTSSFPGSSSRDYTYRLAAFSATRHITIDTCVAGVDAWDTILYVFPDRGVCSYPSGVWYDDQGSECGQDRSRVTFIASAGVDYLVVVEGYYTSCGVPAINVTSTLVQAPPNITSIGSCINPHNISVDLGSSSWVPTTSTCDTTNSFSCLSSRDYTYRLPAFNATRNITIDTCVAGVDAWDTFLVVFQEQGGACTSCPSNVFFDDQGSECGQGLSRVTFIASAGVDYLVVVEGSYTTSCGTPAINVTSTLVQAPPNITSIGSCINPHNISVDLGSSSWVPTTSTCNTTNSFPGSSSRDYTYRLAAFSATRHITIDTCVAGVDAWDTILYVLPDRGVCSYPSGVWYDDQGSECGQDRSRVTFIASAGVDYLVVVEGYYTSCGVPAINVTSTLVQAPPNITSIGSCINPHNISLDLGSSSWVPTASTCNTTNSFSCLPSGDYTYRLPAFNATRNITIDTCVAGVDAWDTVLFVFPEQDGACTSCPSNALFNDQGSICGQGLSRVTFNASAGVDYLVVVEGYYTSCGVPAINVTSTLVQAPPNIIPISSCSNPHNISLVVGYYLWSPRTSTCDTTNSFPCRPARDYTYRLQALYATRSITIDTCVGGVDAWDTVLYVFPEQGGECTYCPSATVDDDGSMCGQGLSRVTFIASAGVDYLVVVEGSYTTSCGVPAINVTSTVVQDSSNIIPKGSCINPHNISVDLGSSSWVPTNSTCDTTNSFRCSSSRDYTYRLPAFNATRNITIDTCVAGVDAWDTILYVFPDRGVCTCPVSGLVASCCACSVAQLNSKGVLMLNPHPAYNTTAKVTSPALALPSHCSPAMVGYRAVCGTTTKEVSVVKIAPVSPSLPVPGWTTWWWWRATTHLHTSSSPVCDKVLHPMAACLQCGVPAINVTSTLVQAPPNITSIGSCINPHNISLDLGSSSWVPTASTCNTTDSFPCLSSRDYTYRLAALNATRNITIDTCVAGVDAWDTVLFVFPEQDGACTSCPSNALFNDQGSECGQGLSRVTFNASAGVDYLVVVEGYYTSVSAF